MKSLALLSLLAMTATISTAELQCPNFNCTDSKEHCIKVSVQGGTANTTATKNVDLSKCENSTWHCDYNPSFWINDDYQAKCAEPVPVVQKNRLPGEPCQDNSTCVEGSLCQESKCTGKQTNETCNRNEDCVAGNWCQPAKEQGANRTCAAQVSVGGNCTNEFECVNNAFCFDGHCTLYFSLAVNTTLKENVQRNDWACESTTAVKDEQQVIRCVEPKYVSNATDGVVECKYGEICKYEVGLNVKLEKPCVCGYNAEGKGYCPYDFASQPSRYTNVGNAWRNALDNKCHTTSRFKCPESDLTEVAAKGLEQQVAYHKAVDCARAVLSSGYLAISFLAFIAILI